jgi:hypothetical protein
VTGTTPPTYGSTSDRWFLPGAPTLFMGPAAGAAWGTPPALTTGNNKHWGNPTRGWAWQPRSASVEETTPFWREGSPLPRLGCGLQIGLDPPHSAHAHGPGGSGAPSLIDELMNGVVFYRGRRYDISLLDTGVMIDIGLLQRDGLFANGFE